MIIGIDEAGRGALAGPVCVAAVAILNKEAIKHIPLNDSKQLTPNMRYRAYTELFRACADGHIVYGVSMKHRDYIDKHNILEATRKASSEALANLLNRCKPDVEYSVIMDGNVDLIPKWSVDKVCEPKADSRYQEVMAASIIAKVLRDIHMIEADMFYPGYDFANSKGYPSQKHMDAIIKLGPCDIHRKTFKRVKEYVQ